MWLALPNASQQGPLTTKPSDKKGKGQPLARLELVVLYHLSVGRQRSFHSVAVTRDVRKLCTQPAPNACISQCHGASSLVKAEHEGGQGRIGRGQGLAHGRVEEWVARRREWQRCLIASGDCVCPKRLGLPIAGVCDEEQREGMLGVVQMTHLVLLFGY